MSIRITFNFEITKEDITDPKVWKYLYRKYEDSCAEDNDADRAQLFDFLDSLDMTEVETLITERVIEEAEENINPDCDLCAKSDDTVGFSVELSDAIDCGIYDGGLEGCDKDRNLTVCENCHAQVKEYLEKENVFCPGCNAPIPDDDNEGKGTLVDGLPFCNWCKNDVKETCCVTCDKEFPISATCSDYARGKHQQFCSDNCEEAHQKERQSLVC